MGDGVDVAERAVGTTPGIDTLAKKVQGTEWWWENCIVEDTEDDFCWEVDVWRYVILVRRLGGGVLDGHWLRV